MIPNAPSHNERWIRLTCSKVVRNERERAIGIVRRAIGIVRRAIGIVRVQDERARAGATGVEERAFNGKRKRCCHLHWILPELGAFEHRSLAPSLVFAAASIQIEHCSGFTSPHYHSISPPSIPISIPTTSRLCAAKSDNKEDALKDGRLVEFTSGTGANKQTTLGAIIGKEGKKNLKILHSSGRTSSVPLRSIKHVVPNAREIMTQVQIEQQETAAANALEKDAAVGGQSVAEVWEMLLEDCNDDESCASDATAC
eukprot:scaffold4087_cov172-Chaetoceros_neogracile.AAC.3